MTLLILAQKVKEEKKKNSLVLLILSLVSIFGHINSTPNAQPSFRACYEGKSVRGMTFQWRKRMDQWITFQNMGKDKKGWLRGGNYSHATCLWEFLWVSFFIQPYFTVAFSCSSLCTDSHEQNCPSVLQMVQLSLYSCHTDFILILAAWNTWLRVSSWAPCPKSEVKSRVFFFS